MKKANPFLFLVSIFAVIVAAVPVLDGNGFVQVIEDGPNFNDSLVPGDTQYPPIPVTISLGNRKQNAGLAGEWYGRIYTALNYLCPERGEGCDVSREWKQGVQVTVKDQVRMETLYIKADRGYWGANKALRRLMIGSIAGAAEKMVSDSKNCYDWTANRGGRSGRHCNMGDFISATVNYHNFIDIRFRGSEVKRDDSHFDCVAVIEATDNYLKTLQQEYLDAFHLPQSRVIQKTWCLGKDVTK